MQDAVFHHMLRAFRPVMLGFAVAFTATALPAKNALTQPPLEEISVQQLPPQGRTTYRLIFEGGPFPFEKDGSVFGNRERLLPFHQRGYYREYTVPTPRAKDRGARRIVCGGYTQNRPRNCYYTSDHYNSFRKITP